MNALPDKPQPTITDLTRPFWTAAKEGRLVMQKCSRCETVNFHPKPWCIECSSRDIPWVEMKRTGTVYSYTVSHTVAMNFSGWEKELPVILALVDIDDGARMYAQVTGIDVKDIAVGMRVEAYFDSISDEAGIPKFRRA